MLLNLFISVEKSQYETSKPGLPIRAVVSLVCERVSPVVADAQVGDMATPPYGELAKPSYEISELIG